MFSEMPNLRGLVAAGLMLFAIGATSAAPVTFGKAGASKEAGAADNSAASCTSGDCEVRGGSGSVGEYRNKFETEADFIRSGFLLDASTVVREAFSPRLSRTETTSTVTYSILSGGSVTTAKICDPDPPFDCFYTGAPDNDITGGPLLPGSGFAGRWDTTKDGAKTWFEFYLDLTIDLGAEFEVFGFYLTDLGDTQQTAASIEVSIDGGAKWLSPIATTSAPAGVMFMGVYSETRFQTVKLRISNDPDANIGEVDFAGLDDIVVGNLKPVGGGGNLPEPGSLALVGLSLIAASRVGRRRKH